MKKENERIGEFLRKKRTEKNMSMQAVADQLGVTPVQVHYWESGKRTIYAYQLVAYCRVLGVSADDLAIMLYGGENE